MTDELKQQIKEWLKESLVLEQSPNGYYGSNSVEIRLRFIDEHIPFTSQYIYIPNEET